MLIKLEKNGVNIFQKNPNFARNNFLVILSVKWINGKYRKNTS